MVNGKIEPTIREKFDSGTISGKIIVKPTANSKSEVSFALKNLSKKLRKIPISAIPQMTPNQPKLANNSVIQGRFIEI